MTLKNKNFQKGFKEIPPPSEKGLGMGFPPFLPPWLAKGETGWKGCQTPKSLLVPAERSSDEPDSSRVR